MRHGIAFGIMLVVVLSGCRPFTQVTTGKSGYGPWALPAANRAVEIQDASYGSRENTRAVPVAVNDMDSQPAAALPMPANGSQNTVYFAPPSGKELPPSRGVNTPTKLGKDLPDTVSSETAATIPTIGESPRLAKTAKSDEPLVRKVGRFVYRPGDLLEILYLEQWPVTQDYHLHPGDEIRIEYLHLAKLEGGPQQAASFQPSGLDRTTRIAPDGKISLPYLGLLEVKGQTLAELNSRLERQYADIFVHPRMNVSLVSTGAQLRDLRESFRVAGSRLVRIAPDGTINVPRLGVLHVDSLTPEELQRELSERMQSAMPGTTVTVRLAVTGDPNLSVDTPRLNSDN